MTKTKHKILSVFLSFCMIISCMVGMSVTASADATPEVTLDFTGESNWNIPDSGNSNKNLAEFTDGTHTIKLFANTNYKLNPGYLLLGKTDSYLELPAFDFDVEKIVVTGASTASTSVRFNIFVGGTAVSTEATGSKSTNTFEINSAYQSAGNVYKLIVLSSHNIQISKIEIYKKASTPPSPQWTNGNVTATLDGTKLTVAKTDNAENGNMGTGWVQKSPNTTTWASVRGTITEVEIKDGVTSIGLDAFHSCAALTSVTIPGSVTSIGLDTFRDCSALTSVTIPSGVTSIGKNAFKNCGALATVTFEPRSKAAIESNAELRIEREAFKYTVPGATVAYGTGDTVLYDNNTPITTETLLTAIQDKTLTWKAASSTPATQQWTNGNVTATLDGTKLTVAKTDSAENGDMGTSWTKVGSAPTWSTIKGTITEVEIKDGVTSIGANAFNGCSSLTSVTFPSGLTSIGDAAFANCSALTSVTFPSSLNSIGQRAFHVCTVLASVTFTPGQEGGGLTIGDSAFDDIPSTTKVTYGTGNTVLYDDTTEITTDTLLTAIQRKTLTWKAASSTPATTTEGFVKVTDASQITEDNIAETTTADAKAWIKANLDALKSEQGTWYDFFWKENGTLKVVILNYIALDETHVNEENVYDPVIDDVSRFFNNNENVYFWGGSSTPATTDVSFVRATSAEELQTNLPKIPTYTKEQAEAWIAANKATLASAFAAHQQAHNTAFFIVVYAISGDKYSTIYSGASDLSYFNATEEFLDNLKYNFTNYYGMIYYPEVTAATHTHTWGYNADGATITANCTGTGTCDITEGLTLTISAPTALTYDGTAKEASLSTGYNTTAFPGTYTTEYYNGTTKLGSAPVNAGTYTAKVTAGTGDGAVTASVDFTITPKTVNTPTITLSPESFTYDGSAHQPTVTVKDGTTEISGDEYTVTYSNNTNAGTATVTITDKTGGNYTVSGTKTFTIAPASQTAPVVSSTNETIAGKADGTITGVTTAMEYKLSTATEYTPITGTSVTGLAAGTYNVRYAADANHEASPAADVVINVGSKITVQFDADGGTPEPEDQQFTYGQKVSKPETDPTKTGYTFKFWSADGTAEYDFSKELTANITLKAIYTANQYTITFDTAGGSKIDAITQDYGTAVTAPADPTRAGLVFAGWEPNLPATMPAYDMTVRAHWNVAEIPHVTINSTTTTTTTTTTPTPAAQTETMVFEGEETISHTDLLSWTGMSGATSYLISVEVNNKYVPLAATTKTNIDVVHASNGKYYVSEGGDYTEYTYKSGKFVKGGTITAAKADSLVKANNVTDNYMLQYTRNGQLSSEKTALKTSVTVYYKPTVTITTGTDSKTGKSYIRLKWAKVPGATSYKVCRYVNGKLKTVSELDSDRLSVKITGTKSGKTYTYAVKAFVDGKWTKVYASDLASIKSK